MARRALLLASEVHGLAGCEHDMAVMEAVLGARGFGCTALSTAEATRSGLEAALGALVGATAAGDAVVVYFAGHGGRLLRPDWSGHQDDGRSPYLQFIVPSDIDDSSTDDFRGLLTEELTVWQRRLTDRTANVTTILDCCHAGSMVRDLSLVPRALSRTFPVAGALARLADLPAAPTGGGADTNQSAVRLVACRPDQSAYEQTTATADRRHGVFTTALAGVLGELGDQRVSWATVGALVRRRVLDLVPSQRPEVEGPVRRHLFSTHEAGDGLALPVITDGTTGYLEAAPVFGIGPGDTFRLRAAAEATELATAVVDRVEGTRAVLRLVPAAGSGLPDGCWATPLVSTLARRAVAVSGNGGRVAMLEELAASPLVRPSGGGEAVVATIVVGDDLTVRDTAGALVTEPILSPDEEGRRAARAAVERLARAQRLVALPDGEGPALLSGSVAVELATHEAGQRTVRASHGEPLFVGDALSVTLRNPGPEDRFVWLFDVGITGRIALVTNDAPSGHRLGPAGSPEDRRVVGGTAGRALDWSTGVPTDQPRPETMVVIVADRPQDLSSLESPAAGARGAPPSSLDAVLDEVRVGVRDWAPEGDRAEVPGLRYRVETVDFLLHPGARPRLDEPSFEIDDRRSLSVRSSAPRAAVKPPSAVAVRLAELAVRRNGALFKARVRLDALVLTRTADGVVVGNPTTLRFPNIADGEVLPLENALLHFGEVHDFLDLALWVWRDDTKGRDLSELFAAELARPEVSSALQVVGGLVVAAPEAAAGVAAVAATAAIVRMGATLVHAVTRRDIGIYRTSWLAFEGYGLGRRPPTARQRSQDIEFAYEVVDVSAGS